MAIARSSQAAKKRILTASVRLFLEKGYTQTTVAEILREADVSASTFQNIFRAKEGVLVELAECVFGSQFGESEDALKAQGQELPPVCVYALETAVQLALTELNEKLRDIYLAAYQNPETLNYLHQKTTREIQRCFGTYLPECTESDFYEMEIGSCAMMGGYMAKKCDPYFTLERKVKCFLTLTFRAYKVPEEVQAQVLGFVSSLDIRSIAEQVMRRTFKALAIRFEFKLEDIREQPE